MPFAACVSCADRCERDHQGELHRLLQDTGKPSRRDLAVMRKKERRRALALPPAAQLRLAARIAEKALQVFRVVYCVQGLGAHPCFAPPCLARACPLKALPTQCLTPLTFGTPRTAKAENARRQDARSAGPCLGRQEVWRSLPPPLALVSWAAVLCHKACVFWRRACFLCWRQVA